MEHHAGEYPAAEHPAGEHRAPVSYSVYILVWLGLLVFTGLTVAVAGVDLRNLAVATALSIAAIKTILVISFFMHLKYEDRLFMVMMMLVIVTLAVILALTFIDTVYR